MQIEDFVSEYVAINSQNNLYETQAYSVRGTATFGSKPADQVNLTVSDRMLIVSYPHIDITPAKTKHFEFIPYSQISGIFYDPSPKLVSANPESCSIPTTPTKASGSAVLEIRCFGAVKAQEYLSFVVRLLVEKKPVSG